MVKQVINQYYELLGFLTKPERYVDIYTHENQRNGARSSQGKLETKVDINVLPRVLKVAFNSSGNSRISVTDYVNNLELNGFTRKVDATGKAYTFHIYPLSYDDMKRTVPTSYTPDFERGYNL